MQIIYFILLIGLIIFVHELGHLLVAKFFGVYCAEFALGMGPKIFSFKGKETIYSIRAIPVGGFVSMAGEDSEEEEKEKIPFERTLPGIAPIKRICIMLAGVAMNFILSVVLMTGVVLLNGGVVLPPPPVIETVMENTPASEAGLMAGDVIIKIVYSDGVTILPKDFNEISSYNEQYNDERTITVDRNGQILTFVITPEFNAQENRYLMGITIPPGKIQEVSVFSTLQYGVQYTVNLAGDTLKAVANMLRGVGLNQLSGPVAIYNVTGEVMSMANSFVEGVIYFFNLAAILSISLMIMNLLPIPVMDGGRVLLILIEMIIRKPVNKQLEQNLMVGSAVLLLLLTFFITYQDIFRILK